jgi:Rad3-related DNA helicase
LRDEADLFFNFTVDGHEWSYRIGVKAIKKKGPKLIIKPLTAALNAPKLIGSRNQTVLMSATLGKPEPLARELGFKTFDFVSYPHPIPKEYRPVFDMGYERMTWENSQRPSIQRLQAFRIAQFIETLPPVWRGVILTSSYLKKEALLTGLRQTTIARRLFKFEDGSVSERIRQFSENKTAGMIAVDIFHSWGHGVSFDWDKARFIIVASVPFGELRDPFQIARKECVAGADEFSWWHAYNSVPQACGRVSRGEILPNGEPLLNVALLADGSATTKPALSYYPKWFSESISKWQG